MPPKRFAALGVAIAFIAAGRFAGPIIDLRAGAPGGSVVADQAYRSPVAVAISPDRQWCATANQSSGSVSLIHIRDNQLVTEAYCGRHPTAICWIDPSTFLVTLKGDGAVAVVRVKERLLEVGSALPVGVEPVSICLVPHRKDDGPNQPRLACVAVSREDVVAVIDIDHQKVVGKFPVGAEPQHVAAAPNGRWIVSTCTGIGDVYVHEVRTWKQLSRRVPFDEAANLGVPAILPDSSAVVIPHLVNRSFPVDEDNIEKGWVIDNRLTKLPLPGGEYWDQAQLGLDTRGSATGDAHAVAVSPDGDWLVVTCGGTHELLIFRRSGIPWPPASPGDFIPAELLRNDGRFRRLKLGGRPLGVEFVDNRTIAVANFLLDAVQFVDVVEGKVTAAVAFGQSTRLSAVRRGAAIFYDADRSLNSWFSCHSCHVDGHTSGRLFDTLNDGNFDTYKLTPSLRGVTETGPWTWHGWQTDLRSAIKKSMHDTLHTTQPFSEPDVDDLIEFLKTLQPPVHAVPDPKQAEPAIRRGADLFAGKGGCAQCHRGEYLTSPRNYDVGTGSSRYVYRDFNPPSLRGLGSRRRFLHDGRARSLDDLVKRHHRPEDVAGESLTNDERDDLVEYLKSL